MNALGIYSQDGDRLTSMDFRWTLPQVPCCSSTANVCQRTMCILYLPLLIV